MCWSPAPLPPPQPRPRVAPVRRLCCQRLAYLVIARPVGHDRGVREEQRHGDVHDIDEAEKRADQRSQDAQSFARKQANLDAEEVANARQAGQNEGVIRTPDGHLTIVQRDNSSSANRAFNIGAQTSYFAGLQADMRQRFARLATDAQGDPERFRVTSAQVIEQVGGSIDPAVRGEALTRMRILADDHYAGLLDQRSNADRTMGQATWQRQLASLRDDVNALAEGGQIGSARYAQSVADLERHIQAGVGSRFIDRGTADLWRNQVATEGTARAIGTEAVRQP